MMYVDGPYLPLRDDTKEELLALIASRSRGMAHSIERVEYDKRHLAVRCPESGVFITIFGSSEDLRYIDYVLGSRGYYKPFKR